MTLSRTMAAAAAATAMLCVGSGALAQQQQPVSGGTSGGLAGRNVSASTYGQGTTDGASLGVTGGGQAGAVDGEASTDSRARLTERHAMQRSTAVARTDDEIARSRTRTTVRNGVDVRSRTTSMYRDSNGGRPERESVCTRSTPQGTVTSDCHGNPN